MEVSDILRRFVKDHHLNQASVARDMGISGSKLNAIVNGRQKMDAEELVRFCRTVGVDPEELLSYGRLSGKKAS